MSAYEDVFLNPLLLDGSATAEVLDPAGITPPHTIIQTDDAWLVRVNWQVQGLVSLFMGGDFHVEVHAESIGAGFAGSLGSQTVAVASVPPLPQPRAYQTDINVAAGTLAAGAYRLVTLITYSNGGFPQELAAFVEGPIIQMYDPA